MKNLKTLKNFFMILPLTICAISFFCIGFYFGIFFRIKNREKKIRKEIKDNSEAKIITIGEDGIMRDILENEIS